VPIPPKRWSVAQKAKVIECPLQTQEPVLNEVAKLLGISLRETEDELTRDMLASTAVVIACVNGVNGKSIAVIKSSLIDLETLRGNRAQA